MKRWILGTALLTACAALHAQTGEKELDDYLKSSNLRFIAKLDADVTGDGVPDVILVCGEDRDAAALVNVFMRRLGRSLTDKRQTDSFESASGVKLDLSPLGPPTVRVEKGILFVDHLAGGAHVRTEATYKYRFNAEEGRMQLIGMEAKRTSSTLTVRLSYNPLTGVRIFKHGNEPESKWTVKPSPVWMDLTSSADREIDRALEKHQKKEAK